MTACPAPVTGLDQKLLEVVWENEDAINLLSPCQLSSLIARELVRRRQDGEGQWEIELTETGYNLMQGRIP